MEEQNTTFEIGFQKIKSEFDHISISNYLFKKYIGQRSMLKNMLGMQSAKSKVYRILQNKMSSFFNNKLQATNKELERESIG